ncbi:hypothetical protein DIPPA_02009 [Diplonema papillatum]|nr:hypothetical protein DIPPA_02009 [Diplonema papillatum]
MSKSFARPASLTSVIVPGQLTKGAYFKEGHDNIKPIDYSAGYAQYVTFKKRTKYLFTPRTAYLNRRHPEFGRKRLTNPWARQLQQESEAKRVTMRVRQDPQNPYRPLTFWDDPIPKDAPLTQFRERFEYPHIPNDPWFLHSKRQPRPTSLYWREPAEKTWMERGLEHPHDPHPMWWGLTYCILREDIPDLGQKNDVVAVHHEQFRTDLHPNRLAVVATKENCELLGVFYDPLYQDYPRRELQGKLMHRQPWIWDQLQGVPWDVFSAKDADDGEDERNQPWTGEIDQPVYAAEMVARRKAEAQAKKAIRDADDAKLKERKKGAAAQMFDL